MTHFSTPYFGNAVKDAVCYFSPDELPALGLSEISQRIRSSIKSVTLESVKTHLKSLEKLRQQEGLGVFENVTCPGLLVSNLSQLPLHEINFGLGAPLRFSQGRGWKNLVILTAQDGGILATISV
jgi:AAA+ superfamily predicted ATPase